MTGNESRTQAIYEITNREPIEAKAPKKLEDIWASNVFSLSKMQATLPKDVFKSLKETIKTGKKLDPSVADTVAGAMRDWAISKGAMYYAHVFYPLTGGTAEKHDGFISPQSDGGVISEFSGKLLIQGEPDGSSFPNGGIRDTFEARGYTGWDVTSPAYILENEMGATLCIPTVFVSWTGEALDKKTPLLRSIAVVDKAANRVLKLLGNTDVAPVNSSCGAEQEYFLVDANFANARPDLLLAGRTLFGKAPAKGQQFDDHYFGAIPPRVQAYMHDIETRLYKLGIPAKTSHNEVAPGQFEIAPVFESANVASDHQQQIMTTLRDAAVDHGFMCLLHEKPFAGINGSGKHVNWSIGNSTQGNLLDPGDTPEENLQFLAFCGAVIRGVHLFGPLMRAVIATASNDHRLGANEAPPAIMSVYLGSQLEDIFNQIKEGKLVGSSHKGVMHLGVDVLPPLSKDAGDRNRTSPFAFTGNRFEFRAVGSSQSVSGPLIALNTMMADSLSWIADQLEAKVGSGSSPEETGNAVQAILKDIMDKHGVAVFGGNGYSDEWHKEAVEQRGLLNIPTTADALPYLKESSVVELFKTTGVLSPTELESRFEVYAEQYILSIEVEAKLVVDIAKTLIYPAVMRHLGEAAGTVANLSDIGVSVDKTPVEKVAGLAKSLLDGANELDSAIAKHDFGSTEEHMDYCAGTIRDMMNSIREAADTLEGEIADDLWPLPTYEEMLFIK
ncbi:glutamine synthetase, catalytic domain, putative [Synechococcus sp. PCC 7335]|uniref:glutamine synthetase III family protein n=1 Tax=Synechococcus sp. (strain ATCC 29403 / PCC 7335) TaxID=91464 RepID=UPI00017EB0A8|nr:glutamine synthetase III [Synechococcus sp. PCC 7335]EDX85218.1 glutamine synthetase, catalytic domain, putative [Synechococcus sp. PCC 7335]